MVNGNIPNHPYFKNSECQDSSPVRRAKEETTVCMFINERTMRRFVKASSENIGCRILAREVKQAYWKLFGDLHPRYMNSSEFHPIIKVWSHLKTPAPSLTATSILGSDTIPDRPSHYALSRSVMQRLCSSLRDAQAAGEGDLPLLLRTRHLMPPSMPTTVDSDQACPEKLGKSSATSNAAHPPHPRAGKCSTLLSPKCSFGDYLKFRDCELAERRVYSASKDFAVTNRRISAPQNMQIPSLAAQRGAFL